MPKLHEIESYVASFAPPELAEEWDNSGTLVDCGGEVKKALCALDITSAVVAEAEAAGCQLILAHHPVIFHPLKKLRHGEVAYKLVRKHISAICAHTNLDAASGGVNDILAAILGVMEPEVFARVGRVGEMRQPVSATQLAETCSERFSAHVRYVDAGRVVKRLALLGGSGGGLVEEALAAGADCIFTGEADHHDAIDAREAGISLVVAGHYSTEFPVVPVMADRLIKRFPDLTVLISRKGKDPFQYADPGR